MAPQKLNSASEMLTIAGSQRIQQVILPDTDKEALLIGHHFRYEEIQAVVPLLKTSFPDTWLDCRKPDRAPKPCAEDTPVNVPTVRISPGLKDLTLRQLDFLGSNETDEYAVAYILLVRGASGAIRGKLRICYSWEAVGPAILEEVIKGYSIAFSAAVPRVIVPKLSQGKEWMKTEWEQAMYLIADDFDKGMNKTVALLC